MNDKKSKPNASACPESRLVNLHPRLRRIIASFVGLSILTVPLNKTLAAEFQQVVAGWRRKAMEATSLFDMDKTCQFLRHEINDAFQCETKYEELKRTDSIARFTQFQTHCLQQNLGWMQDENVKKVHMIQRSLDYLARAYGIRAFAVVILFPSFYDDEERRVVAVIQPTRIDYITLEGSNKTPFCFPLYGGPSTYAVRPAEDEQECLWIPLKLLDESTCPNKCDGSVFCLRCRPPGNANLRNWCVRPVGRQGAFLEPTHYFFPGCRHGTRSSRLCSLV